MVSGVTEDPLALPGLCDERKDLEVSQSEGKIQPLHLTAPRSRDPRPQAAVGGEPELQEVAREAPVITLVERDRAREKNKMGK